MMDALPWKQDRYGDWTAHVCLGFPLWPSSWWNCYAWQTPDGWKWRVSNFGYYMTRDGLVDGPDTAKADCLTNIIARLLEGLRDWTGTAGRKWARGQLARLVGDGEYERILSEVSSRSGPRGIAKGESA
jgi:hypothetical protein